MAHAGIGLFTILFFVIFGLVTLGILGVFVFIGMKLYTDWKHNSQQPLEFRTATLVAKRTQVSGHEHTSTQYFATFEFETGERREFAVPARDFGLLVEGDAGRLSFQGSWFRSFVRQPAEAPPVMANAQPTITV